MRWAIIITILLFILPFFWLQPGQMDLGGDENRLFFYDPANFIYNNGLFLREFITLENRAYEPFHHYLPFVSVIFLIKSVINSPYFLISLLNGIKVSISFFAVYLIIKTILNYSYKEKRELFIHSASILGGLLYMTAPIVIGNYEKALLTHNQIFLNPLCFYLLLLYFIKGKFRYMLYVILLSIIFTTNFSWASAPPIFAFYPLAFLFLFFYVFLILKKKIKYRQIIAGLLLYVGLHAFHILPVIYSLLSSNSYISERVFSSNALLNNLNYFYGILPLSNLSYNLMLYAAFKQYPLLALIPTFFMFLGFCFNPVKNKTFFLTGIFFIITLYLVTANITESGVKLYELFFSIPGYSMFRNFIGQWAFVFTFFYALLFGQALYFLFKNINNVIAIVIICFITGIAIIAGSWNFFTGGLVNTVLFQSNGVKVPMEIDPNYVKTLEHVRNLKKNGAFVSFPFTDSYETVIHGTNDGAYQGPSPINWLVGTIDYNGYTSISPFGEIIFSLVKERNYTGIKKLLGLMNVEYIYYNDDPKIYDRTFPGNPYNSTRAVFPRTQSEYKTLVKNIAGKNIYHQGTYYIYETDKNFFHSEFYAVRDLKLYSNYKAQLFTQSKPFFDFSQKTNDAYLDTLTCLSFFNKDFCSSKKQLHTPEIYITKINPTLYKVNVVNAKKEYLLIFSRSFSKSWDISLATNNIFKDVIAPNKLVERQIQANGYANAWYIKPSDVDNKSDYTLIIQLANQKIFYIGIVVTMLTALIALVFIVGLLLRKKRL